MSESGVVTAVENGVATVQLVRRDACGRCGLCTCGADPGTMELRAYAPEGTVVGETVEVEVDRRLRGRAQLWLLGVPLAAFLGVAWVVREILKAGELWALGAGIIGMGGAYVTVWLLDRWIGWSKQPLARIVRRGGGLGGNSEE
ncbi:MAG: SoxR reducing system RseC family protein [bacterium]|nr:SoxR reducing system RseC family protein [bacterium]